MRNGPIGLEHHVLTKRTSARLRIDTVRLTNPNILGSKPSLAGASNRLAVHRAASQGAAGHADALWDDAKRDDCEDFSALAQMHGVEAMASDRSGHPNIETVARPVGHRHANQGPAACGDALWNDADRADFDHLAGPKGKAPRAPTALPLAQSRLFWLLGRLIYIHHLALKFCDPASSLDCLVHTTGLCACDCVCRCNHGCFLVFQH